MVVLVALFITIFVVSMTRIAVSMTSIAVSMTRIAVSTTRIPVMFLFIIACMFMCIPSRHEVVSSLNQGRVKARHQVECRTHHLSYEGHYSDDG